MQHTWIRCEALPPFNPWRMYIDSEQQVPARDAPRLPHIQQGVHLVVLKTSPRSTTGVLPRKVGDRPRRGVVLPRVMLAAVLAPLLPHLSVGWFSNDAVPRAVEIEAELFHNTVVPLPESVQQLDDEQAGGLLSAVLIPAAGQTVSSDNR